MSDFKQDRFDELMREMEALRKKHDEERAVIERAITAVLFPNG